MRLAQWDRVVAFLIHIVMEELEMHYVDIAGDADRW